MSAEKRVIFGQLGRLKPEKIEEYEALHAAPWPEVLQTIHDCNLRNYSIFREGEQVFAYFEYIGEDYDADMEKMAQDEATQRWWTTYTKSRCGCARAGRACRSSSSATVWARWRYAPMRDNMRATSTR